MVCNFLYISRKPGVEDSDFGYRLSGVLWMSIIVAVKKAGSIAVAADTMHSSGSHREYSDNLISRTKLRKVGSSCLAGVGWSVYDNIIDHYVKSFKRPPVLKDEMGVFEFFLKLWKAMRSKYQVVNDQPDKDDRSPFADLDSEFIVANKNGIFQVSSDLTVMQFEKYVVIGSGDKYAYGAIHAIYDTKRTAEQIAQQAVQAAVYFEQTCGGEIEVDRIC